MFRLPEPEETFPTEVTVKKPDGEKTVDAVCSVTFRCLSSETAAALSLQGNAVFLQAAIAAWDGIHDEHGEAIAFSEESLKRLSRVPYFAASAVDAYFDRFHRLKNL